MCTLAATLVAAGCNSTTRLEAGSRSGEARGAGGVTASEELGVVSADAPAPDAVASSPAADASPGGSRRAAATAAAAASGATTTSRAEPGRIQPGGAVAIGIHVSEDLQAAYAAFGARGAEGDLRPAIDAVVKWINEHGGMGGRQVTAVYHGSDALNGSFDAQAEAACSFFTEDQPVFAVVSGAVLPSANLPDCMAKKKTPLVWNYHYLVDQAMWDRYRQYLYMPFAFSAERLGPVYADELVAAGFFGSGARVGIVRYDNPQHRRFSETLLRPRLRDRGVNVVEEIALRQPPSAAAAGDTAAQIGNGILRLRGANVSHVVFVPSGGAVPFIFMNEAEGQRYRPRYAMNTLDIPYFVSDQAPASQLDKAIAIGWSPASDTRRPQTPLNDPRKLCYDLTNSHSAHRFCDGLFFLKAALDRQPVVDVATLQAAVEGMGTAFDPVFSLATRFAPGRHDGASAIRVVAYNVGCECFEYTGPVRPVG